MIKDVLVSPLDVIDTPGGSVMHAIKKTSEGYKGFGEAYFSNIEYEAIKAWKRHRIMTLNLVVPYGEVQFVLFDNRNNTNGKIQKIKISQKNYCRLTVPPLIWMGFKGLDKSGSIVMNIGNIQHDPLEVDKLNLNEINYKWS